MIADVRGTIAFRVAHKDFIQQPMIHIRLSSDPRTITAGETKRINQVSYMWGCFAAGTLIKMADNTLKPLIMIKYGQKMVGCNQLSNAQAEPMT